MSRVWCPVCGDDAEWKQGATFAGFSYWRCGTCELAASPMTWAALIHMKLSASINRDRGEPTVEWMQPDIQAALRGGETDERIDGGNER